MTHVTKVEDVAGELGGVAGARYECTCGERAFVGIGTVAIGTVANGKVLQTLDETRMIARARAAYHRMLYAAPLS